MHKKLVFVISFLISFSIGIAAYTNSSFANELGGQKIVGVLYALGACIGIAILSKAARTVGRIGALNFFLVYSCVQAAALFVLIAAQAPLARALAFIAYLACIYVVSFAVDVLFEHVMPVGARGKTRGIFLLLGNCAWFLAPLAGIFLKEQFDYAGIYASALVLLAIGALIITFGFSKYKDAQYTPHRRRFSFSRAWKNQRYQAVIFANFILQFFYVWMVIYVPIYLNEVLGFSWDSLAIVFTCMLASFVILDYPLGKIADYFGSEKEFAAFGFAVMFFSVLGFFILPNPTLFTVGVLLFFSRVGAATVEAMTEIHFFKIAKDSEPELLSAFRDLSPASYILAPLIGTIVISFLSFRSLFAVLALLVFAGFISALHLEKDHAWWVREHKN